jgi:hypothetical protein
MGESKESTDTSSTFKSSTARDLAMPLKVVVSPLGAFKQLASNPTAKGLLSLVAFVIVVSAAALYASATRIVLTIDGQYVGFIATSGFSNWFLGALSMTVFSIALYWLAAAVGLALISRFSFKSSRVISLRTSLVIFGYLLSVFVVLYVVRAAIYFALPPITFASSTLPQIDEVTALVTQNWAPLPVYLLFEYSAYAAFVWLFLLGTMAIRAMKEISWFKAGMISLTGFLLTLTLFGLP